MQKSFQVFTLFIYFNIVNFILYVSYLWDTPIEEACSILVYDLSYSQVADRRILELETKHDMSRIWLHVDMDAFYAAVETLSNPSLKGKPMAVGGLSMISTANYEVGNA